MALMQETETGQKKLYGKRKVEVKEGCDLDEHKAHVFLERLGETLTVTALRKRLKELDIDMNKVKRSSVDSSLIFRNHSKLFTFSIFIIIFLIVSFYCFSVYLLYETFFCFCFFLVIANGFNRVPCM